MSGGFALFCLIGHFSGAEDLRLRRVILGGYIFGQASALGVILLGICTGKHACLAKAQRSSALLF